MKLENDKLLYEYIDIYKMIKYKQALMVTYKL